MSLGALVRRRGLTCGGIGALSCLALWTWVLPPGGPDRWCTAAFDPRARVAGPVATASPHSAPARSTQAVAGPATSARPAVAEDYSGPDPVPVWHLVGLGDSVLTRCSCPGVLADYADLVAEGTGRPVQVDNAATPGATSSDLLRSLEQSRQLRSRLATAEAVVVFVGANDFTDAFDAVAGGASPARFATTAEKLSRNLARALTRIRQVVGEHTPVLVCGYWNDFKDGRVARRDYSPTRRRAAAAATDATNDALAQTAEAGGAVYISTATAFEDQANRSALLDPDGDHLSGTGSRIIAAALLQAVVLAGYAI